MEVIFEVLLGRILSNLIGIYQLAVQWELGVPAQYFQVGELKWTIFYVWSKYFYMI